MNLWRTAYKAAEMATALLPRFKQWARIDHNDDDALLTTTLTACIASLERQLGIYFAPQSWAWVPNGEGATYAWYDAPGYITRGAACAPRSWANVPIPIRGIVNAKVDRGGVDVSDAFTVYTDGAYHDFGQAYLRGNGDAIETDDVVTLETPQEPDELLPEIELDLFRYTLFVWENRQSGAEQGVSEMPDWVNRSLGPLWSPRL